MLIDDKRTCILMIDEKKKSNEYASNARNNHHNNNTYIEKTSVKRLEGDSSRLFLLGTVNMSVVCYRQ